MFLPDIDRILLKYKHLGLTKEQQLKILEQLSLAIEIKISKLTQEIREEDDNQVDGKQLVKVARSMFNLTPTDPITMDQLNYVLGMSRPSNYLLQHHTINGKPLTFNVPNYDTTRALSHRPWQKAVVDDINYPDLCVIKSRQLGLILSSLQQQYYNLKFS